MTNDISFTGIKNIATVEFTRTGFHKAKNISMILTDDVARKDLQEYRNVLKNINTKPTNYVNEEYPDLLNLEYLRGKDNQSWISLNGTILEENDDTLPMFSYLAKLMKRITKKENVVVNQDYKDYFAKDTLIFGTEIDNYEELAKNGFVENIFDKEAVIDTAKNFISHIQEIMNRYFDIK